MSVLELGFLLTAIVAVAATLGVITGKNPVRSLLCLIVSLLSVAMIFFMLGAPFAGMLEIIVYAGAIMVLFVFVVMMLNLGSPTVRQEKQWLKPQVWIGPAILAALLLGELVVMLLHDGSQTVVAAQTVDAKKVGVALYGPYLLAVELASMLLLAAMVTAWHLGRAPEQEAE